MSIFIDGIGLEWSIDTAKPFSNRGIGIVRGKNIKRIITYILWFIAAGLTLLYLYRDKQLGDSAAYLYRKWTAVSTIASARQGFKVIITIERTDDKVDEPDQRASMPWKPCKRLW